MRLNEKDKKHLREIKERIKKEDAPEIRKGGYHVSPGIGVLEDKLAIVINLSPLEGRVHPGEEFMEELRQNLADKYNLPFSVRYIPNIQAYKE